MRLKVLLSSIYFFICLVPQAHAQAQEIYQFKDSNLQQQFKNLNKSLRCLVCQNQDLADSHAPLARDLRQQIYQKLKQGQSPQQITDYLTARYGDFILFKPPLKASTYILWLGPWLFLLIGFAGLVMFLKRKSTSIHRLAGS